VNLGPFFRSFGMAVANRPILRILQRQRPTNMKRRVATLTFVILAVSSCVAQLPLIIDPELFFGDPEVSGAQISPDGSFVSFLKPFKGVRNIWIKERQE
jgi:hypothetical protein